jgi:hypothetical protein
VSQEVWVTNIGDAPNPSAHIRSLPIVIVLPRASAYSKLYGIDFGDGQTT